MTVKEIVAAWMKEHGYDGLYNDYDGCGCSMDDFIACEGCFDECRPGRRHECPCTDCDGECAQDGSDFMICGKPRKERDNA